MATRMFERPVCIVTDAGPVREIATPFEAYTFLTTRKTKRFDISDAMLRRKCSAASMGMIKPQTARAAFVRYAEKHGILASEIAAASMAPTPDLGVATPA